jgi:hypothetical protein
VCELPGERNQGGDWMKYIIGFDADAKWENFQYAAD